MMVDDDIPEGWIVVCASERERRKGTIFAVQLLNEEVAKGPPPKIENIEDLLGDFPFLVRGEGSSPEEALQAAIAKIGKVAN